ncbi:exonuclease domain-containing protein [Chitinimonas sp.]|uniref:3'-5' exonuclease family protein n=1 Tax=Chitinimonas sp. TaxID=1934313 RepID=UPI0035AF77AF
MLSFEQPFVFVDLETTGANAQRDRITEVGIVEWDGEQVSEWSSLVNPQTPIPPFIQQLTGINDQMVSDAPTFAELAEQGLLERLRGRVFVAHNARFDYGFLKNEFRRLGCEFRAKVVCTVKLSKKLFPGEYKHNLDIVAERNGLAVEGERHRALTDARLIYRFLHKLRSERSAEELAAALDEVSRQASLPAGLDPELIDAIPDCHGVYLLYGENDLPLYIGKGNNIKKRVLSHFAADLRSAKEARLGQQVKRIDWRSTAGELGALLLEAQLVKSLQPLHNRRLRKLEQLCAWQYSPSADGSAQPQLKMADADDFARSDDLFGLYHSSREASNALRKMAEANKLCTVVMGLDRASRRVGTPCFGMQVGRCRGACIGKETLLSHQARLCAVLARIKLKRWPYRGRVALREQEASSSACDWHIIDHWRLLATVSSEAALADFLEAPATAEFDADIYKILSKHLAGAVSLTVLPMPGEAQQ